MQELRAVIDDVAIVRRHDDLADALEPVFQILRVVPVHVRRADRILGRLPADVAVAVEPAFARAEEYSAITAGLRHGWSRLTAADAAAPVSARALTRARHADRRAVLLAGV